MEPSEMISRIEQLEAVVCDLMDFISDHITMSEESMVEIEELKNDFINLS